jgi:formyl-CoA transferase
MDEMFADPQVQHLKMAADLKHPRFGDMKVVNQGVDLSRTPNSMVAATPERGADTDEVLREAGYTDKDIAAFHAKGVV